MTTPCPIPPSSPGGARWSRNGWAEQHTEKVHGPARPPVPEKVHCPEKTTGGLDPEALQEVALRPGRFWCLPDDPAAGHPDAVAVPDAAALGTVRATR